MSSKKTLNKVTEQEPYFSERLTDVSEYFLPVNNNLFNDKVRES